MPHSEWATPTPASTGPVNASPGTVRGPRSSGAAASVGAHRGGEARVDAVGDVPFGAGRLEPGRDERIGGVRQLRRQVVLNLAVETAHEPSDEMANDQPGASDVDRGPRRVSSPLSVFERKFRLAPEAVFPPAADPEPLLHTPFDRGHCRTTEQRLTLAT